jgi:hypothetical protein
MKDVVLLAVSFYLLKQDVVRATLTKQKIHHPISPSVPSVFPFLSPPHRQRHKIKVALKHGSPETFLFV